MSYRHHCRRVLMIELLVFAVWAGMALVSCYLTLIGVAARPAFDMPIFRYTGGVMAVLTALICFAFWRTDARCRQVVARKRGRRIGLWEASLFALVGGVVTGAAGAALLLGLRP